MLARVLFSMFQGNLAFYKLVKRRRAYAVTLQLNEDYNIELFVQVVQQHRATQVTLGPF